MSNTTIHAGSDLKCMAPVRGGCDRKRKKNNDWLHPYCQGHLKRHERGLPMDTPLRKYTRP